jgi:hypothetical protein
MRPKCTLSPFARCGSAQRRPPAEISEPARKGSIALFSERPKARHGTRQFVTQ